MPFRVHAQLSLPLNTQMSYNKGEGNWLWKAHQNREPNLCQLTKRYLGVYPPENWAPWLRCDQRHWCQHAVTNVMTVQVGFLNNQPRSLQWRSFKESGHCQQVRQAFGCCVVWFYLFVFVFDVIWFDCKVHKSSINPRIHVNNNNGHVM